MEKKVSKRTKDCRKQAIIFRVVSIVCWLGVAIFAVIAAFSKVGGSEKSGIDILSEAVKTKLISLSVTVIVGIIISLLIKEKARITIYMLSLILLTVVYGETAMYIVLAVWALDEYLFNALYKKYKRLIEINKEIDKRV